jgi:hypothetical protein
MNIIKCENCQREHKKITENCCWINCGCNKQICGQCGYAGQDWIDCDDGDEEDQYWCCKQCPKCNLKGCGMCI